MQARHRQTMFLVKNGGTQVDWAVFLEKRRYADRLGHTSRQNEGTQIDRAIFLGKNEGMQIDWAIFQTTGDLFQPRFTSSPLPLDFFT